jgi:hypothetical protein
MTHAMALYFNTSRLQWQVDAAGNLRMTGTNASERWVLLCVPIAFGAVMWQGIAAGKLEPFSFVFWIFGAIASLCIAWLAYNAQTTVEICGKSRRLSIVRRTRFSTSCEQIDCRDIRQFHTVEMPNEGRDSWKIVIELEGRPALVLNDFYTLDRSDARAAADAANRILGCPLDETRAARLGLRVGLFDNLYVRS